MSRMVPVGKLGDESQKVLAQVLVRGTGCSSNLREQLPRLRLELQRAGTIAGVRKQQRGQNSAGRCQRPSCPRQMQCIRMAVANVLLACGMFAYRRDRKVDLGQSLAIFRDHSLAL